MKNECAGIVSPTTVDWIGAILFLLVLIAFAINVYNEFTYEPTDIDIRP